MNLSPTAAIISLLSATLCYFLSTSPLLDCPLHWLHHGDTRRLSTTKAHSLVLRARRIQQGYSRFSILGQSVGLGQGTSAYTNPSQGSKWQSPQRSGRLFDERRRVNSSNLRQEQQSYDAGYPSRFGSIIQSKRTKDHQADQARVYGYTKCARSVDTSVESAVATGI